MKTLDKQIGGVENISTINQKLDKITQTNKDKVNKTLAQSVNVQMNKLFSHETSEINAKASNETNKLSNENEVTYEEEQLAKLFGKSKDFGKLKNINENIHTLSIASVMNDFEQYEEQELLSMAA